MLNIRVAPLKEGYEELPGIPSWLSRVLWSRGVCGRDAAEAFLNPGMDQWLPPDRMPDMDKTLALLTRARDEKQKAVIYGDYDVDGVCASAILMEAFAAFGLQAKVYLPDRHKEGYGLNENAVRELAKDCQLLVTVDCGITALSEVTLAKELGMTVIVTDHHRHLSEMPPADAVMTPLLKDYPFPYLCGAGVAFKVAQALLGNGALPLMELAALATVADMVSLTGENRALVKCGLERLSATQRPGLRAVMNRAGIFGRVSSDQAAFQIAPRMNACGRMDSAGIALEMLLTRDLKRAEELAVHMESLNQERREQEEKVLSAALRQAEEMDLTKTRAIVAVGEGWNSGVVGLAAGRIAEKYCYPTVALARDGELCVGSARSAGEIDVHLALSACADLFERFGGHKQAAGLTIRYEKLEEFKSRLSAAVSEQTGGEMPRPQMLCDGEMRLSDVTEETAGWLEKLEPFGVGNPAPRFLCRGAKPLSLLPVGSQGKHLKCVFQQENEVRGGIFFGAGEKKDAVDGLCRMVMTPVVNEFRGKKTAECRLYALETLPETLGKDLNREQISYLTENPGEEGARSADLREISSRMAGGQGTLLVCRCLETALAMQKRFPKADFSLGRADDPRAYDTVMLYGNAGRVHPAYRLVVLCDGDLGEGAGYKAACPGADVVALERSEEARRMLADLFLPLERMRESYALLRRETPRDLSRFADLSGLTPGRGAFALTVLSQIDLIELCFSPFRVSLPPMTRRSPEESALYRRCRRMKEEC